MKNFSLRLLVIAVLVSSLASLNGCRKGEEDPFLSLRSRKARIAGTWTATSYEESSTYLNIYDDSPNFDDEIISSEGEITYSYSNGSIDFTSSQMDTYDGDGFYVSYSSELNAIGSEYNEEFSAVFTDNTATTTIYEGDYSSSASFTYTFDKDGTFEMSRTIFMDMSGVTEQVGYNMLYSETESRTTIISGTWAFVDGNDDDDFKNGERISLWFQTGETQVELETENETEDTDPNDSWNYDSPSTRYTSESTISYNDSRTNSDETWEIIMLSNSEMKVINRFTYDETGEFRSSTTTGNTTNSTFSTFEGEEEGTIEISFSKED
jgi:hypothetical protein